MTTATMALTELAEKGADMILADARGDAGVDHRGQEGVLDALAGALEAGVDGAGVQMPGQADADQVGVGIVDVDLRHAGDAAIDRI